MPFHFELYGVVLWKDSPILGEGLWMMKTMPFKENFNFKSLHAPVE